MRWEWMMSEECWKKVVGHVLDMRQRYGEDGLTTDEQGIRWADQRIAELEAAFNLADEQWSMALTKLEAAEAALERARGLLQEHRFDIDYGGEEIGTYRIPSPDCGDFVDADELAAVLKGEGK